MTHLPACGPEGPIRARTTSQAPLTVQAVLFDFSGTLFQIGTYADRIRAAMAEPVDDVAMDIMLSGLEAGLSDPDVIEAQRGRDVSSRAHHHAFTAWYASVPELAPVADVLYEQLQAPEHWVPYADTESTLVRLTQSGVVLGVVSDVGWDLRATFAHHGLDHYFSSWVHSYEHDTEKPDPLLFQHACRELGVAPEETLMVGDHPAKDGGAAGAGLRSYVLPGRATPGSRRGLDAVLRLADRV
ncbi:HAD-IA family hydrolase [Streptomyces sp. NBC_00264]|uniref:HAD family hydrolase n=1 Tax=unclassified Streptomyces TaxID=2593676 RepID=UPI0022502156|nr:MULTISPECIES: HAD-IA family hydrolase [unclassified Streptomyces]WSG48572.1 HAD-IA family hydrolase [Streptomyces sp. NBC_01732]MCX4399331.1 HAD-IA family hydrolase [Streptomyces sp. NBC_01767]MCX5166052.1 HAD-IA family hydrolase [Streptomyces sp. NBC_00305]MCX5224503.1 HAD-IA family hydrolase [Streptomyces sp. NBC_00264]WSC25526.1 HAD-IA family hydrolase [Streptomyces sp. NBC_01768]